eukprot:7101395-Alexandrium_andersonii.AAC.1
MSNTQEHVSPMHVESGGRAVGPAADGPCDRSLEGPRRSGPGHTGSSEVGIRDLIQEVEGMKATKAVMQFLHLQQQRCSWLHQS